MPAYIIYINGFPGVGKLTVARALQPLIPGYEIIHNHELIDPVEARYPRGSPYYQEKRSEYRRKRLEPIKNDASFSETVFIFTDSQTEQNDCVSDYLELAEGEDGRRFYSVILHCEAEENEKRLVMAGRGGGQNGKLTDVSVLREYRAREGILKFGDEDEVEIDVTHISPGQAARQINAFVAKREKEGRNYDERDLP